MVASPQIPYKENVVRDAEYNETGEIADLINLFTLLLLFSSGKYDDSAVRSDIEELESRVTALEQQCRIMNGNISALQALVAAVQGRDCVVSVADLSDGTGYSITFASGRTVTLRNGKDGSTEKMVLT